MLIEASRRSCPICEDLHVCHVPVREANASDGAAVAHVGAYVEDELEPVFSASEPWTNASVLYRHYRGWALRRNVVPVTRRVFAQCLRARGVESVKRSTIFYRVRIRGGSGVADS